MRPLQNIRIALQALRANKLRSALTMLGIIIGVASVVSLLSVGAGAQESILGQINGIGTNLITVVPGVIRLNSGGPPTTQRNSTGQQLPLVRDNAEAIAQNVSGIAGVAPEFTGNGVVTYQRNNATVQVRGVTQVWIEVRNQTVAEGRWFDETDDDTRARVTVLGADAASTLFDGIDPIGQRVKINNITFTVIGVMKRVGGGITGNQDAIAYVPLSTIYRNLFNARTASGQERLTVLYISAENQEDINLIVEEVKTVLRQDRKIKGEDDDFTVLTQEQFLNIAGAITGILTVFLGAIAGISLLVGGIGIMNISLVSVAERTKEIGLRKAVGAKRRTIMLQFLVETVTLSLIGGSIGIALGILIALGISATNVLEAVITWNSIALAFGFSAFVGLFFGIYPATRAANLQPIEALRYE
jgi:putative ABC transport system permease protein